MEKLKNTKMNRIQKAALAIIQSDAQYLYTIAIADKINKDSIILLSLPYLGLFAFGTEQWFNNMNCCFHQIGKREKEVLCSLRLGHKLFEKSYIDLSNLLMNKLKESDAYFKSFWYSAFYYDNISVWLFNGEFIGNTVLTQACFPQFRFGEEDGAKDLIQNVGIAVGEIAYDAGVSGAFASLRAQKCVIDEHYNFYKNIPLKEKSHLGLVLFSVLCSINFCTVFMENYFLEEIPQKLKFAYLLYYYLCDFSAEINKNNGLNLSINKSLKNREFRNCLAHYGLSCFMEEKDIIEEDTMQGLTIKAFGTGYLETKKKVFEYLNQFKEQIQNIIF